MTGTIFNIQKFSLHDGDGIRTTVFLKGCPLRCLWCHNPESHKTVPQLMFYGTKCTGCTRCIGVCPARETLPPNREKCIACGKCTDLCLSDANEICGRTVTAEEVMAEVVKDRVFYESSGGGMTVSGGEPAAQPDFTLELIRLAKEEGITAAMETSGFGTPDFFREAAELGTAFLYDLKAMNPTLHKKLTGVDNAPILKNLRMLLDMGADVTIRMPLVPGLNDSDEDIAALAEFLRENEGRYRMAEIMPYHAMGVSKSEALGQDDHRYEAGADHADRWVQAFADLGCKVSAAK
ncbi:MAG: glycyl-radical enzyme activating protein [Ruminococcaceae bacterium]|nr:glycyl-radical enzyme activating protein [Oscillospiraceae bacterium]